LKARAPRWEARAATVSNSDSHRDTPTPQRRQAFSFSRDLQFATEPELAKRMGCPRPIWLRAALKELIDNSLDAAEEAGIEAAIRVALDENILSVSDNGPGMSPELVERLCIRSERTSTREAYAAPDRGVQGNAVQVIVALPLGLGRDEAVTAITSRGVEHRIILKVNRLQQQLEVERTERAVPETPGTKVGLTWPSPIDANKIAALVAQHAVLNPHARFQLRLPGYDGHSAEPTPVAKWTPGLPTPAHWYALERFGHRVLLEINRDRSITVAQFLGALKGLTSRTLRSQWRRPLASPMRGWRRSWMLPAPRSTRCGPGACWSRCRMPAEHRSTSSSAPSAKRGSRDLGQEPWFRRARASCLHHSRRCDWRRRDPLSLGARLYAPAED
jgi:hypothetical protein